MVCSTLVATTAMRSQHPYRPLPSFHRECPFAVFRYQSSNELPRLNLDHSFQCEICHKFFTSRGSLLRHKRTIHNPTTCQKYYCPEPSCRRHRHPFLRSDLLVRHQKKALHFDDSPQPWSVYSQRRELPGDSSNNPLQDLDQLMQTGRSPVQLNQRSLYDQRQYLRAMQQELRSRCSSIQSQMQQLISERTHWEGLGHDVTQRISEIDQIENLEYRHGFGNSRMQFS